MDSEFESVDVSTRGANFAIMEYKHLHSTYKLDIITKRTIVNQGEAVINDRLTAIIPCVPDGTTISDIVVDSHMYYLPFTADCRTLFERGK